MKSFARAWRKFIKRHAEAIFIIAFILTDCFLSGWALTLGTAIAILYVCVPALRALVALPPIGRVTFLKAFVKTSKVQRLGLLLFWIYSMRFLMNAVFSSNLLPICDSDASVPSISNALILGAQQWAPLAFLSSPLFIYAAAAFIAIFLRAGLKASKQDPDLIRQRQNWSGAVQIIFLSAFITSILSITLNTQGPSYMLSNWLLASGRDANLWYEEPAKTIAEFQDELKRWEKENQEQKNSSGQNASVQSLDEKTESSSSDESSTQTSIEAGPFYASAPMLQGVNPSGSDLAFIKPFDTFILCSTSMAVFIFLLEPILKLNAFLTSFCWRVVSPKSLQNIIEGFLEALRLPARNLNFSEAHPFWSNAGRTVLWLLTCYAVLFWLFGFCSGPLGDGIHNWMMASIADAGFVDAEHAPDWLFDPRIRIFLGAIVALYGTAPIAITAPVVLPYAKPRKIVLNCDGISFAQGPFLSLWGRQFRLWSDLKSLALTKHKSNSAEKAKFTLAFRSGGQISFSNRQIQTQDLKVLLDCIDQHAPACSLDTEVYSIFSILEASEIQQSASDGKTETTVSSTPTQEFKSTIFTPFASGDFLPGTQTRIIKQLSSKPLCAVYLGRTETGRMVTIKQFYLPEDTEETQALAKILRREYELLTGLDHPGIAKVVDSFTVDKSTFLLIEHRLGIDLRQTVQEHGPRSEALTIAWARQLCKIMIYLHGREPAILHRDLTPDNIIAGEDGQLRLIDFGAAREFLDGITGTMIGKHCYVAPEQLRGNANQLSDIYSFGGTLYFLLTGRDPQALLQSSPAKNIDCSDEIDKLIQDCTAFDEEQRPKSFTEVLGRLNETDKGVTIKLTSKKLMKEKAFV